MHDSAKVPLGEGNPFDGIAEKLKRANENILNLNAESAHFFGTSKYPVIPHPDDEHWQEAVNYHRKRKIPLRFSVLAGEIIHHLRSSLDHIVWYFSSETVRNATPNMIEFPIFKKRPVAERPLARYNGKIQGISNAAVRELIGDLQPYHSGADASDHPLSIIHDMDRFDKHRELTLVSPGALVQIPADRPDIADMIMLYQQGKVPASKLAAISRALKEYGHVTPQIAFRNFGKREYTTVIPALQQLSDFVTNTAGLFADMI